jgi:hypothetical protein
MGYSPESNDLCTEDEESPLLEAVAGERLVNIQLAGRRLSGLCGDL